MYRSLIFIFIIIIIIYYKGTFNGKYSCIYVYIIFINSF